VLNDAGLSEMVRTIRTLLPMSAHVAGAAGHPRRPDARVATAAWADLAANRPGSGAEERARQARQAAPLKSALGWVFHVSTDEKAWRVDAAGQRKVGTTLSRLGPAWRVLHAVPVGENAGPVRDDAGPARDDAGPVRENHPDIDHLVIGPPGIFTLSTKYHRGGVVQVFGDAVRVDGAQEPYVSEARYEAWRAACLLTAACGYRVIVAPAVVIVGAEDVRVARPAEGVQVLDRRHLLRWLTALPPRLKPAHVTHLYEAARRSDTWLRRTHAG
jgi:hypothetical protein